MTWGFKRNKEETLMSKSQDLRTGCRLVGALGVCLLVAGTAGADVTTERPGSILIFPKVVNDGVRQTVIQITNTHNQPTQARCFYLAGDVCSETDFDLAFTKQQPTHWNVGAGISLSSLQSGLAPGLVPPVPTGFAGALICVETGTDGSPSPGNALKGEATIFGPLANESKYNGIALLGDSTKSDGDDTLTLDGDEYNACPGGLRANFVNPGVVDPGLKSHGNSANWGVCSVGLGACSGTPCGTGGTCNEGTCSGAPGTTCNLATAATDCGATNACDPVASVTTTVTVLPCNINLDGQIPNTVTLQFETSDGKEEGFSSSKTMNTCWGWGSFTIDVPVIGGRPGTDFGTLSIFSVKGGPVVGVVEAEHTDSNGIASTAAVNIHVEPGVCDSGDNKGRPCTFRSDCTGTGSPAPECVTSPARILLPAY
jgi:hypothetical protein